MQGPDHTVSEAEARGALDSALSAPAFANAPRMARFLGYVVEETLEGRADRLNGYSIGLDVFDRDKDFDPSTDSIVRVEARRLRRTLADYYAEAGAGASIEISLPKGVYVPEFRHRAPAAGPSSARPAIPDRGPSIAVLPLDNFSGDPADQFFADGLTEETIANLARFKDLFVFSRSTTTKLAREGAGVRQFHEELGADFVLEGSVRRSPNAVRVTVQLIDAAADGHVLAENFDRPCTPGGVFEIQDEIAGLVAGRIADRYGPLGRYAARARRTGQSTRWETYRWIMRFYDYYSRHDPELHRELRDGLPKVLEADPESSDGWAALSAVLLDEHRLRINERPGHPALQDALEYALRAVSCDPENAFAYQALAMAYFHVGELNDFRLAARRSIELNPGHADVLADAGLYYCLLGEWDEGLPLIDRALALSPVAPGWYRMPRARYHLMRDEFEAALRELKAARLPGLYWYHAYLAAVYAELGQADQAKEEISKLLAVYPDFEAKARDEFARWGTAQEAVDRTIAALRKAGLEIE